ncbi:helix-turn-helix transcriptional regulator [Nitrospina watsonii]|uniref:HTH luxR-type domain-containing protein n=1 Tax=Nitrospina watsonii TaxID=1323948 RepID=A0ABN8W5K0_9BACT|nr:LuxR C-terminal-related transcriptional regulator [Nitrospina watsonii]CAI2718916.1 HTH luxR-type domain-containing protein [Nitrospina watsonii]
MDDHTRTSLPEEIYLGVLDLIGRLQQCHTRSEFKDCIKNHILPFFDAEDSTYGWVDVSLLKDRITPASAIGSILIPDEQLPILEKISVYLTSIPQTFTQTHRQVIAHDVDIPRKNLQIELQNFFKNHPEYQPSDIYRNDDYLASLVAIDRTDNLVLGVHRYAPNNKYWTRREIRLMELLRPSLFNATRRIAIQELLQTYKSLIEALEKSDAPFALVQENGRILFGNAAFQAIVPIEASNLLPQELRDSLEQQMALLKPDPAPMAFYKNRDAVYRLIVTRLHPEKGSRQPIWLLRLHPVIDPCTAMHRTLQTSGLTPREVEVAILAGDGFSDKEITQRLFISPSTLKNHLKHIYQKLGVHSRTQLVARLRPSPEPQGD